MIAAVLLLIAFVAGADANRVVVGMRQQNMDQLRDIALSVSDPSNAAYGSYLTRDQLRDIVASSPETVAAVTAWLRSLGAQTIELNPRGDWITARNVAICSQEELEKSLEAAALSAEHIDIATFFGDRQKGEFASFVDEFGVTNVVDHLTAEAMGLSDPDNAETFVRLVNTESLGERRTGALMNVMIAVPQAGVRSLTVVPMSDEDLECKAAFLTQESMTCSKSCARLYESLSIKSLFGRAGTQAFSEYCSMLGEKYSEVCIAVDVTTTCISRARHAVSPSQAVTVSVDATFSNGVSVTATHANVDGTPRPILLADQLYDPTAQKNIYNMPTSVVGESINSTQAVWGTGTYGYSVSDLAQFYSQYNVPTSTSYVHSEGYAGVVDGDNFVEGQLDNQYITGLAPQILTTSYNNDNSSSAEASTGFGPAMVSFLEGLAASSTQPDILSISLGSLSYSSCNLLCELYAENYVPGGYDDCTSYTASQFQVCMYTSTEQMARLNDEYMALVSLGVSVFAAAGDGGNHFSFGAFHKFQSIGAALNEISCNNTLPTFPASSPWVTAVGGTMMTQTTGGDTIAVGCQAQKGGGITGGCGFSWQFAMPSYQQSAVEAYLATAPITNYNFNASGRAYPDVSAIAANIPIINDGRQEIIGGTSASTPEIAGVFSIINDQRLANGLPRLGFINPRLYQAMADSDNAAIMFVDVTEGTSECGTNICCDNGFVAQQGWDAFTGFGNPLYPGLLQVFGTD